MNNIEWKEGAVCFAIGWQWFYDKVKLNLTNLNGSTKSFEALLECKDFQLNEPQIGDYIEKSELDTEEKYNDTIEVFGLFFFEAHLTNFADLSEANDLYVIDDDRKFIGCNEYSLSIKRKLTYNQLMAIGKLKRMMLERGKSAPKTAPEVSADEKRKPIVAQVMIDLTERMEVGIKEYGEALRPHNGRDALQDAYEEALDLACYLKQAIIERDS